MGFLSELSRVGAARELRSHDHPLINLGATDTLEALGELDNTIIVFTSDNGGTGEGGAEGTRSYFSRFVHHPALPGDWTPDVDRDLALIGGPRSLVHYPRGWGLASNTPSGSTRATPTPAGSVSRSSCPGPGAPARACSPRASGPSTSTSHRSSRLVSLRSFEITVVIDETGEGVLVSHGDQGGGYSLYVEDGRRHLAYNEYGVLHETDAGPLTPGEHVIALTAEAEKGLRWSFTVSVDGEVGATPPSVHQLIGMAPFQGISIGIDRKSPVSWPLFGRHRSFRYQGTLRSVTYTPGEPGPDSPEAVAAALKQAAAAFE